ncbi:aldehyde dehydrogenase family protein [Bradymonas sediminis]|nr:aldehyde dehydrogenase family protein [Bradymonas sediminis]TDP77266.1 succinate-semialdehyde dehydrogenase/glutarate-semialdehyde dehydrogenase [Bradymonas sediminis]
MGSSDKVSAVSADPAAPFDGGQPDDFLRCVDPSSSRMIARMAIATPLKVEEAARDARRAFAAWRRLSVQERCDALIKAGDILLEHRKELLDLLVAETGKAIVDAQAEFLNLFETLRYYTSNAPEFLADARLSLHLLKNKRARVEYMPLGVVVNISPWNFPLDLSLTPAIPALLAGNAVLIKPSEHTPLTVFRAVELMNQSGLPAGILQTVMGRGDVGALLVDQADAVTFTGSVSTGRKVAVRAAERLIPCTLELGGKDPAIVLEDADIERAARGVVWGAFFNSGQVCMSVERVFVHEAVYDAFVERVVALTAELRQGVPHDYNIDVGAMIDPGQFEIIEAQLREATAQGARVLIGGERVQLESQLNHHPGHTPMIGDFFAPTVVVDVDPAMKLMREETFGPVLPIMKVRSAFEAVKLANDSEFGLNASVWGRDIKRARKIASQVEAGQVCINDVIVSYAAIEAPYGGIKNSGLGRRKGSAEIYKFVESKTVLEDIIGLKKEPYWYPYHESLGKGVDKVIGLLYQRGVAKRIKSFFR